MGQQLIDELDIVLQVKHFYEVRQFLAVNFPGFQLDDRMGLAPDNVKCFGMALDHAAHGFDAVFNPFAGTEEAEGGEDFAVWITVLCFKAGA
ncbi:hypothetical protein D3C76_1026130 [compost metagenome]